MISINGLNFNFGGKELYRDASLTIKPGDRIGLIGRNGTGKSTLLRVLSGEYQVSKSELSMPSNLKVAFFNQDLLTYHSDKTVLGVSLEAFSELNRLQDEIDQLLEKLDTGYTDSIAEKLHEAQERFGTLGGYTMEMQAAKVLNGLGFSEESLHKPYTSLSGGWRMRAMLAKCLLEQPDLLMLDEPTNHLDLPAIKWIEMYLQEYEGMLVVVSHDRYFLDRVANKIAEVEFQEITLFPGNYSFYMETKAERQELQQNSFENQQKWLKEQERFIERFRSKASKATAVQSRIKMLEKTEKVEAVQIDKAQMNIRLKVAVQPGKVIDEIKIEKKAYGENVLFNHSHALIQRGDKIGLIGANGLGKTTLLRMIAGIEPFEGEAKWGHNVNPSFFAQHQLESLNPEFNILDELQHAANQKTEKELRSLLGAFLFSNDDVFKKIKVLSGGERSRVALAKMMVSEANFLMLDEPTNHLDVQAVDVLVEALQAYEGSYVVITHDRHFLERIAHKIWYIEDKQVKEFPGDYHEYEKWMSERSVLQKGGSDSKTKTAPKPVAPLTPIDREQQKQREKEIAKRKKVLQAAEEALDSLTKKVKEMEVKMNDPNFYGANPGRLIEAAEEHRQMEMKRKEAEQTWEEAYLLLEEMEGQVA